MDATPRGLRPSPDPNKLTDHVEPRRQIDSAALDTVAEFLAVKDPSAVRANCAPRSRLVSLTVQPARVAARTTGAPEQIPGSQVGMGDRPPFDEEPLTNISTEST